MPYNPATGQWEMGLEAEDAFDQSEIERQMRLMYPQGPPKPRFQQSPDARIGGLSLPGNRLDSAALAVLQSLQNQPAPQGFGANFVSGLAGGLAGGRARQAGMRQRSNEAEMKRVADEQEEQRRSRAAAGATLAGRRWEMYRQQAEAKAKAEAESQPNTPQLRARAFKDMGVRIDPSLKRVPNSALVRDMPQGNPLLDRLRELAILNYGKDKPADPKFKAFVWNMVNDNVRQDDDVKTFGTVRDMRNNAAKSLVRGNSFGDLLAMRFLARASDPNTGVREEEFKTFKNAVGALAARGIFITQEMWGRGMLNDKGREFVRNSMEDIYNTKKDAYELKRDSYREVAREYGLDPERTVPNIIGREDQEDEFAAARKEKPK